MTTHLITLIEEWRAAHPKAWPDGIETDSHGPYLNTYSCCDFDKERRAALTLAIIESAVMTEILKRDDVVGVSAYPPDDDGNIEVCIALFRHNHYGEDTTYPHALLLAERAMREAT